LCSFMRLFQMQLVCQRELDAASACAPDCRGEAIGALVAVPWDCTQYAVCGDLHGDLYPSEEVNCPDLFYFNPNDPLGPSCNAIALAGDNYCVTTCDPCEPLWSESGDTTPNPEDCTQFQVCLNNGVFYYATCDEQSGGMYYDYFNGGCQDNPDYCFASCDRCVPYCI
ncbi:Chitin binding domain, partial [Trinorchestia longiramus]